MTPEQFTQALSHTPESFSVMVKDVPIQYRRWPKPNAPGVLLVHGHAAHARWWDHIGPALHHRFDVSAIDLSGAGDSPHRATYSSRLFAEEMKAVTHHAGYASPIIIAHSFGGTLARVACFLNPHWAQQLILIDSVIPSSSPIRLDSSKDVKTPSKPERQSSRPARVYATRPIAMKRFRLTPRQPLRHPHIIAHIAHHSFRESEAGFVFKFDRAVFNKITPAPDLPTGSQMMARLQTKTSLVIGRKSVFFDSASPLGEKNLSTATKHLANHQIKMIDDAGHHLMVDQPLSTIETLLALTTDSAEGPDRR
ncbi:MAG: alpha/beta hydrolase [Gammaproteobacteria bacterium]|nr:alpha/beta hydrolase [Gammaproteobacteria bacterium]